ncbi:MAG: hypothetical protein ABIF08_01055 [Nanoarchaeota archaeon]
MENLVEAVSYVIIGLLFGFVFIRWGIRLQKYSAADRIQGRSYIFLGALIAIVMFGTAFFRLFNILPVT